VLERGDIESSRVASQRIFAFESAISKIMESVTQDDAEEDTEHELEPEGDNEDYPMHKRRKKTRGEY